MEKFRVCIVEDDPEFREWLLAELAEAAHIECLGCYGATDEAMKKIPAQKPDIVLMDLIFENSLINGIECMLRLKLIAPDLKFMVITSHGDDGKVFEALRVGAGSYILKGDIPRKMIDVLTEFYSGGAPMSPEIAKKVIGSFHKSPEELAMVQQLSPREKEILELLSKGLMYKEIAGMLPNENAPAKTISEGTVKIHVFNIYQKLQVNNRHDAIRKYLSKI
ncbi:MAG: response regulator transcription factor [Saprospiraceae bacterium]|nr:response regulator transcription factor [Saprospiraceae bacterium]